MSVHGLIDNVAVGLGAKFTPKYFREGIQSLSIAENLQNTTITVPKIAGIGDYTVSAATPVGELNAAIRLAQWVDEYHPTVIYHHGASEIPYDYGFKRIFPFKKENIPANLFLVRAPFHTTMKDFQHGIRTLANVVAMLSVSVALIEHIVQFSKKSGSGKIAVAGTSLGGFITNLHHIHYNSADIYTPLLAGLAMDDAYLRSVYSRAVADTAKKDPTRIEEVLNFEKDFAAVDSSNVYPLLAIYDQLIRFEPQKASYGKCPIMTINKGHTTGALSYQLLREHILKHLT